MRNAIRVGALTLSALILAVGIASAQNCEKRIAFGAGNPIEKARFGSSLAGADLNGDHLVDILIGAPNSTSNTGSAHICYGFDFDSAVAVDIPHPEPQNDDKFGSAVAIGRLDPDEHLDLAIGAKGRAAVYVFFGPDFATWTRIDGVAGSEFGAAVKIGPVSDKVPSKDSSALVVGAPKEVVSALSNVGAAHVYVESTGSMNWLASLTPNVPVGGEKFGSNLAIGDVTGDATADLAVSGPTATDGVNSLVGAVWVFFGYLADQQAGNRIDHPHSTVKGRFGEGLAIGDVIGADATMDLVIGAAGTDAPNGTQSGGSVYVLDGWDITKYTRLGAQSPEGGGFFGSAVDIGDVDGDGAMDVMGGEPEAIINGDNLAGSVTYWLGPALTTSGEVTSGPQSEGGGNFGDALIAVDTNWDNRVEIVGGIPGGTEGGKARAGRCLVVDLSPNTPFVNFGMGYAGSTGAVTPNFLGAGTGKQGSPATLQITSGVPSQWGVIAAGLDRRQYELQWNGAGDAMAWLFNDATAVIPFIMDGAGNSALFTVTLPPVLACQTWYAQAFLNEGTGDYRHSPGLQVTIYP